jgi:hypothetical protein
MSAQHTSGPWTVDVLPKGQARRVFTERIEIWQGNSARLVACMHHKNWSIDGNGDLANARLIAAAPELLEACDTVLSVIERVENRCMAADGPVTPTTKEIAEDELREIYLAAKLGFDKATGRAS